MAIDVSLEVGVFVLKVVHPLLEAGELGDHGLALLEVMGLLEDALDPVVGRLLSLRLPLL